MRMKRLVVIILATLMLTFFSTSGICGEAKSDTITIGIDTFNSLTEKAVRASKLHGSNIRLGKELAKVERIHKTEIDSLTSINKNLLEAITQSEMCLKKIFHKMLLISGFLFLVGSIASITAWRVCHTMDRKDKCDERVDQG